MCQDLQKATFTCGHQGLYWWGRSRFCLFAGQGKGRYHTVYVKYERIEEQCPRCNLADNLKAKGLKGGALKQAVADKYANSKDAKEEATATRFMTQAIEQRRTADVEDLTQQIKERLAFYLSRENITRGVKVALLQTITRLDDMFPRQEIVTFFGSRYFAADDTERKLRPWERREVDEIVRKARLERTFKAALAMTEPVPIPVRPAQSTQDNDETASEASTAGTTAAK
ncbi:hypothetical protein F4861DRAFT_49019 [Xylaria intraflava]|nr:hypothetical protein F4861DRAFT_49019 [Xylaria intraflava]